MKSNELQEDRIRENIMKDSGITQDMIDRILDAAEDEEMCKYLGITDWDPADDFSSTEEMACFLEHMFSDNNTMLMLDAINTVARAKGLNQIAAQADALEGKNPSHDVINQMLVDLGFSWNNKTIKAVTAVRVIRRKKSNTSP